jgi:hypothetical protein
MITMIILLFLFTSVLTCSSATDTNVISERELIDNVCTLSTNKSIMIAFRGEVLGRLTSPGSSPDWLYPEGYFDDSSEIRCGDEYVDGCSDRDPFAVTWCVNLWHPTELIQVCINSTGTYSSPAAEQLGIMQNFAIIESCPNYYAGFFGPASFKGCLRINKVKSYYAGAIFTCTALTDTCYNQNFFNFGVACKFLLVWSV